MREIKFRLWLPDQKVMIPGDNLAFEEYAPLKDLLNQPGIMQYTGLQDRNGTEIYEGDILKHRHPHWGHRDEQLRVVEWANESSNGQLMNCGFKFKQVGKGMFTFYTPDTDLEIIGNIHQHPHLLEEGQA